MSLGFYGLETEQLHGSSEVREEYISCSKLIRRSVPQCSWLVFHLRSLFSKGPGRPFMEFRSHWIKLHHSLFISSPGWDPNPKAQKQLPILMFAEICKTHGFSSRCLQTLELSNYASSRSKITVHHFVSSLSFTPKKIKINLRYSRCSVHDLPEHAIPYKEQSRNDMYDFSAIEICTIDVNETGVLP